MARDKKLSGMPKHCVEAGKKWIKVALANVMYWGCNGMYVQNDGYEHP
jgi:hypothetical protein